MGLNDSFISDRKKGGEAMEVSMIAPCLFGLEGLVAEELRRLHMKTVEA